MDSNNINLDFALLSWIRIQYDLTKNEDNMEHLNENLKKLEEYLLVYGIEKLQIIDQSDEYYMLEFVKDGIMEIIKFTVEEVEKFY